MPTFSEAEIHQYGIDNAEKIVIALNKAVKHLLPEVQQKYIIPTIKHEDGIIYIHDISIDPVVTKSSIQYVDVLGWSVKKWKTINNYPYEPDDIIDEEIDVDISINDVVEIVISFLWDRIFELYFLNENSIEEMPF